jgi:proteasome lid subunit RPN8/RPN11
VVLEGADGWRVLGLRNACPGDPRLGFAFEPLEWLRTCKAADACGEQLRCVFHSHVDGPARLSGVDRAWAAPSGEPLLPGALQLVVSVQGGRAREARAYRWEDGYFREEWTWIRA